MPITLALRRKMEAHMFKVILGYAKLEASLGYMSSCLKNNKKGKQKEKGAFKFHCDDSACQPGGDG